MARIVIKCFPAPGFDGVFRAGRKWPSSGTQAETISAEDDVPATEGSVLQIGTKTLAALKSDGRFSFDVADTVQEIDALKARNAELEAENAALKAAAGGTSAATGSTTTTDAKDPPSKKGK